MTRHLLAILALITGLAALTGPASASFSDAVDCNVGVTADATGDQSAAEAVPDAQTSKRASRKAAPAPDARKATRSPLRLPVLMGVDRAIE